MPDEQEVGSIPAFIKLVSTEKELKFALQSFCLASLVEFDERDWSLEEFWLEIDGTSRYFTPAKIVLGDASPDRLVAGSADEQNPEIVTYVTATYQTKSGQWQFDQMIHITTGDKPGPDEFI